MLVRFWGTRGSIPAPGPKTVKYGGNTSCVEVRADDGTFIMLDCGSGARELGQHLLGPGKPASGGLRLHLFIGHTHWDHIQGFPFFVPAFLPNTDLNVYASAGFQRSLEESLAGQMQYSYFPVRLRELRSHIHFTELEEGFLRVGDVLIQTQHLNHTAPTIGYRITADGATVAYSTDHEPFWMPGGLDFHHPGDQRHVRFLEGADLIIHDAQYLEEEYPHRLGWGHATIEYATDVALAAKARRLALFHHDPTRTDAAVKQMEALARRRAAIHDSGLEIFAAAEGMAVEVRGTRRAPEVAELSALWQRPIGGKRVLIVGGTEGEVGQIIQELEEDSLVLLRAPTKVAALASVDGLPPDLVIVSTKLQDGSGLDLVGPLRTRWRRPNLPILVLTDEPSTEHGVVHQRTGATDYLAKPFSPPMLRTRVRAWLARVTPDVGGAVSVDGAGAAEEARPEPPVEEAPVDAETARARIREAIHSVPAFFALAPEQVEAIAQHASVQLFEPGREIIREGSPPDLLFAVLSGNVRVLESTDDPVQSELVLAELGQGEVFGEMGIVAGKPRSATVVAVEPSRCLVLPAGEFLQMLQASAPLTISFLQLLSSRIYEMNRRLARYAPDPLTGLPRRRAFYDQYPSVAAQARRRGHNVILGLIDIVSLKAINDQYGYNVGDEVVRTVADALKESARQTDLIARYGGDEFAVLFADSQPNAIDHIVERLRKRLAALAPSRGLPTIRCDVGVAVAPDPPDGVDELFFRADLDIQRKKTS